MNDLIPLHNSHHLSAGTAWDSKGSHKFAPGMSSAVSTTDTRLPLLFSSASADIASLRTCTLQKLFVFVRASDDFFTSNAVTKPKIYTFTSCLHKRNIWHRLDTCECQTNGMRNSIFSVLKKAIGAPPDVTSYIMKFLNPCVQMVYS